MQDNKKKVKEIRDSLSKINKLCRFRARIAEKLTRKMEKEKDSIERLEKGEARG